MSSSSKLSAASAKKTVKVDVKETETAGLTEKIVNDLESKPNSKAVKNVNKAMLEAWGCELSVKDGKLIMVAVQSQGR